MVWRACYSEYSSYAEYFPANRYHASAAKLRGHQYGVLGGSARISVPVITVYRTHITPKGGLTA